MPLPNFLIIGAAKSATTSLASLLGNHPQAGISKPKEPHFFSMDFKYQKGIAYYESLFDHCENKHAIGDASTSYSRINSHPQVIERILKHLGKPKIIYMVRHPIKRIESAYVEQMTVPENAHITSINDAVKKLPMMVDSSRYWQVYSAYRKHFSKNDIKIVWFEEYVKDQANVFAEVCDFLAIDNTIFPAEEKEISNTRKDATKRVASSAPLNSQWNPKLLSQIKRSLYTDNQRFLSYFEKPENYWR